jgi:hypothetical protein
METMPSPVDINKLAGILNKSKSIMKQSDKLKSTNGELTLSESKNKTREVENEYYYDDNDEKELNFQTPSLSESMGGGDNIQIKAVSDERIRNSKLPESIKESFLKKNITVANPFMVNMDGIEKLIDKPKAKELMGTSKDTKTSHPKPSNGNITININELNEMIDKRVNQVIAQMFTKTISEQSIKKTISTLLSEGKLQQKRK